MIVRNLTISKSISEFKENQLDILWLWKKIKRV